MGGTFAYLFEVRGIQDYVFATGKLRDASGASEIINHLCSGKGCKTGACKSGADKLRAYRNGLAFEVLDKTMPGAVPGCCECCTGDPSTQDNAAGGLSPKPASRDLGSADVQPSLEAADHESEPEQALEVTLFRDAGGVLDFVVSGDGAEAALRRFRALFRLLVARTAPGLAYSDALVSGSGVEVARKAARQAVMSAAPVAGTAQPLGSPLVRPAPRSGASPSLVRGYTDSKGACVITGEFADLATLSKRQFLKQNNTALADQFAPEGIKPCWPNVFSEAKASENTTKTRCEKDVVFPFQEGVLARIAVLHADGNSVGALYAAAADILTVTQMRALSEGLARVTQEAVQSALKDSTQLKTGKTAPARPILLGGDDITIILRADVAFTFAHKLVDIYECKAKEFLESFSGLDDMSRRTLKIGLSVLNPNQPFARGYALSEMLADAARRADQSRIAFWRQTSSVFVSDVSELVDQNRTTCGISLFRASHSLEELARLEALARLLMEDSVGRGALRRVPEVLRSDRDQAQGLYRRALEMVKRQPEGVHQALLLALKDLGLNELSPWDSQGYCPLLQAHDLGQCLGLQDGSVG